MMGFYLFIKCLAYTKKEIPFILFVSTREVGAFNYMTWDQIRGN